MEIFNINWSLVGTLVVAYVICGIVKWLWLVAGLPSTTGGD